MRVAVITVGDEILAGDITNTNAAWLGERLTARGVSVERMLTIPDDVSAVASEVAAASDAHDAVVVTGGLGPTHDDLTMAGVARAFDRDLREHPDVVEWFRDHSGYTYEELAAETTRLPADARFLPNEVGVAPGAVVGNVYVLPGVPAEMEAMFESIADEFSGTPVHVEFVEAAEPESALVDRLADVRERFDVDVGSYPGETVRLKVRGEDAETVAAAADWLRSRVESP